MNFFKPKMEENHKEYFYVEIIAGSIYFAFGVVVSSSSSILLAV